MKNNQEVISITSIKNAGKKDIGNTALNHFLLSIIIGWLCFIYLKWVYSIRDANFWMTIIVFPLLLVPLVIIPSIKSLLLNWILKKISSIYSLFAKIHKTNQSITEIIEYNQYILEIYNSMTTFLKRRRLFFSIRFHENVSILFNNEFTNFIWLLDNLRSDLATRLTEQRQILEWAKSEVERNITGTPELLAVSELQKTRLDRQIEQFEELQRVLVRV